MYAPVRRSKISRSLTHEMASFFFQLSIVFLAFEISILHYTSYVIKLLPYVVRLPSGDAIHAVPRIFLLSRQSRDIFVSCI
jgi:hypothetical protein